MAALVNLVMAATPKGEGSTTQEKRGSRKWPVLEIQTIEESNYKCWASHIAFQRHPETVFHVLWNCFLITEILLLEVMKPARLGEP